MTEQWELTQQDKEWTMNLVGTLREGGSWVVPLTGSVFTFYHGDREYEYLGGPLSFLGGSTDSRIKTVLSGLGWKERKTCRTG